MYRPGEVGRTEAGRTERLSTCYYMARLGSRTGTQRLESVGSVAQVPQGKTAHLWNPFSIRLDIPKALTVQNQPKPTRSDLERARTSRHSSTSSPQSRSSLQAHSIQMHKSLSCSPRLQPIMPSS